MCIKIQSMFDIEIALRQMPQLVCIINPKKLKTNLKERSDECR